MTNESLRTQLLTAQYRLIHEAKRPLIVLIAGMSGAGKGDVANLLSEWMDTRYLRTIAIDPNEVGTQVPRQKIWLSLPAKGRAGVLFWGWYAKPAASFVNGTSTRGKFDNELARGIELEKFLTDDGAVLVKLYLDLTRKEQRARFDKWEKSKRTSWKSNREDWKAHRQYEKHAQARDVMLKQTSVPFAPWHVISGLDPETRNLQAVTAVLQAIEESFSRKPAEAAVGLPKAAKNAPSLTAAKHRVALSKEKYESVLEGLQGRLNKLSRHPKFANHRVVVAFEGTDAAGKGGAIRRITRALDARQYRVIPIAAPTEEERKYPYLWRFWRELPEKGQFTIFDRTWYGRTLVERVEGFAKPAEWKRAYGEIQSFESELVRNDTILIKFYLAISADEQLARFKERQRLAYKQYKYTAEDARNRQKWNDYLRATNDTFLYTHTKNAPWTMIPADDKHHARIAVIETICGRIEDAL